LQDYTPAEVIAACSAAINASRQPSDWYALNRRFGFRGILLGNLPDDREAAGLLPLLSSDPAWRLVYLDHAASFWLRADNKNLPPLQEKSAVEQLVGRVANFAQAENINFFLEKTGLYPELRLKLLEKAGRQWENAELLISLGQLKMQSGDFAAAEEIFQRVLSYKPASRVTLTTMAQLALFRKDRTAAEKYLRKALRHYPHDAELRENLNMIVNNKQ
jgi:tetratricopeptide (TPR) repeat protein